MTSTIDIQRSTPRVTLLTLPLEIRLMIYGLLANQKQLLTGPRYVHEDQTMPEGILGPYCSMPELETWIEDKKTLEYILCTIRRTNKQMAYELAEFITYPRLGLCIVVDYKFKPMLSEAIADCLDDSFAGEHTVALAIYNKCLCRYLVCHHKTKNDKMFGDKRPRFPKMANALDRMVSKVLAPPPIDGPAFVKAIGELEPFKKLEWLHISVNHGDLMEWFRNPTEDFKVFLPMLKKGLVVTVASDYDLDIAGNKHDVYSAAVENLLAGTGEILLEKFDREKYGMKLALRSV